MLVHLDSSDVLNKYVLIEVTIDASFVSEFDLSSLPKNWKTSPAPARVRAMGDDWIVRSLSTVLRVPSTLVPGESNLLLNPHHPDFVRLRIGKPLPFLFDPRLPGQERG